MSFGIKAVFVCAILSVTLFLSVASAAEQAKTEILISGNSAFAVDLYKKLGVADGNIFVSPYSITTALAMTYAGARENTEAEMAKTLRFELDQQNLHAEFAHLEAILGEPQKAGHVKLSVANSLWPQNGYAFLDEYVSLIKKHYGVLITAVDYKNATEAARGMINKWVEDRTQDKIKNLIPTGILDALTRLVLVNAIYFKGNWASQFEPSMTREGPFHISGDKAVQVPMMSQERHFRYAETGTHQILEMPYVGGELSMIVLLPRDAGGLKALEDSMTPEKLELWKLGLKSREVLVFLPRFKMTSMFRLDQTLISMGMVDAFSDIKANFAGMDGRPNGLYIGAVIHKAFVEVNEEGTEAAAATAVVMQAKSMPEPPPIFKADHPFIFLIQENSTGSILFMGRVADPAAKADE